jgi:hypothetical protein
MSASQSSVQADNLTAFRRIIDAISTGDLDVIEELVAPDCVEHQRGEQASRRGRERSEPHPPPVDVGLLPDDRGSGRGRRQGLVPPPGAWREHGIDHGQPAVREGRRGRCHRHRALQGWEARRALGHRGPAGPDAPDRPRPGQAPGADTRRLNGTAGDAPGANTDSPKPRNEMEPAMWAGSVNAFLGVVRRPTRPSRPATPRNQARRTRPQGRRPAPACPSAGSSTSNTVPLRDRIGGGRPPRV